jgi:hypothetical protein
MTTQEIVKEFCNHCCWIKIVYNEYCILYESGKKARFDLLNKIAQNFFHDLQGILIDYLFLNICKLTDPAGFGKEKNLTVKYILEQVDPQVQNELGLQELSEKIHQFRNYIVDARRKLIAHLDVDTIFSKKTLGEFPESAYEQFWADLQEFVNIIHQHYLDGIFPLDAVNTHNSEELICALKKAAYFDQRFKNVLHSQLFEENQFRYIDA